MERLLSDVRNPKARRFKVRPVARLFETDIFKNNTFMFIETVVGLTYSPKHGTSLNQLSDTHITPKSHWIAPWDRTQDPMAVRWYLSSYCIILRRLLNVCMFCKEGALHLRSRFIKLNHKLFNFLILF